MCNISQNRQIKLHEAYAILGFFSYNLFPNSDDEDIDIVGDGMLKDPNNTSLSSSSESGIQSHVYGPPQFTDADVLQCMKDNEEKGEEIKKEVEEEEEEKEEEEEEENNGDNKERKRKRSRKIKEEDVEGLKKKLKEMEENNKCSKCLVR